MSFEKKKRILKIKYHQAQAYLYTYEKNKKVSRMTITHVLSELSPATEAAKTNH